MRRMAGVLMAGVLLTACGGDDEDAAPSTTAATAAAVAYEPPAGLFNGAGDEERCELIDRANGYVETGDLDAAVTAVDNAVDLFGPQVVADLTEAPADRIPVVARLCRTPTTLTEQ